MIHRRRKRRKEPSKKSSKPELSWAAARVSLRIWTLDQTNQKKKALNKLPDAFTTAATAQLVLRTLSANNPLIHVNQPKTTERPEKAEKLA